jgi:hypothetical protein
MKKIILCSLLLFIAFKGFSASILIKMDEQQKNHLKAYGIAFWTLKKGLEVDWLLNYYGGSFLINYNQEIENELKIRGVSYGVIPDTKVTAILTEISNPEVNMDIVKLEKVPKIAVY